MGKKINISTKKVQASNPIWERLNSPIIGPFVISWLICNWRILFITFDSSIYMENKIEPICGYITWTNSLFIPSFAAFAYIFLLPIALFFVDEFRDRVDILNIKRVAVKKENAEVAVKYLVNDYKEFTTHLVEHISALSFDILEIGQMISDAKSKDEILRFVTKLNKNTDEIHKNNIEIFRDMFRQGAFRYSIISQNAQHLNIIRKLKNKKEQEQK